MPFATHTDLPRPSPPLPVSGPDAATHRYSRGGQWRMIREGKRLALAVGIGALVSSCQGARPVASNLAVGNVAGGAPASSPPTVPTAPNAVVRVDRAVRTV